MTIVITMAGLGSRFREAGYALPKYQIKVKGHTLFYWSLMSLSGFSSKNYVFVVRKADNAATFIQNECSQLGIKDPVILQIDSLTAGQAETAALAEAYWNENEPLLIYNIDTYVEPGQMCEADLKGDGLIPCFEGKGDHWSFVRTDETGMVIEVREKVRISNHCTVGAYYFKSAKLYMELYREFYAEGIRSPEAGEQYIAPLYDYLIKEKHGEVYILDILPKYVHVLGTPQEVEAFNAQ